MGLAPLTPAPPSSSGSTRGSPDTRHAPRPETLGSSPRVTRPSPCLPAPVLLGPDPRIFRHPSRPATGDPRITSEGDTALPMPPYAPSSSGSPRGSPDTRHAPRPETLGSRPRVTRPPPCLSTPVILGLDPRVSRHPSPPATRDPRIKFEGDTALTMPPRARHPRARPEDLPTPVTPRDQRPSDHVRG